MRIPDGWSAERWPGYFEVHTLVHDACGFRSERRYDVLLDSAGARECITDHECTVR